MQFEISTKIFYVIVCKCPTLNEYHINQQFLPQFYGSKVWVVNLDMLIGQIDSAHFSVVYINNLWDPLFYTSAVLCYLKTVKILICFKFTKFIEYFILKAIAQQVYYSFIPFIAPICKML
jgi:hypothetical protein